jgi:hypothetical protein
MKEYANGASTSPFFSLVAGAALALGAFGLLQVFNLHGEQAALVQQVEALQEDRRESLEELRAIRAELSLLNGKTERLLGMHEVEEQ